MSFEPHYINAYIIYSLGIYLLVMCTVKTVQYIHKAIVSLDESKYIYLP